MNSDGLRPSISAVSSTMAGVSPSGDSFYGGDSPLGLHSSRIGAAGGGGGGGAGFIMRSESVERLEAEASDGPHPHGGKAGNSSSGTGGGAREGGRRDRPDGVGPVDRLLLLVDDGQSLSRRVLGNERQSVRLGERLSALKAPLWQLQARVRTQAERPPAFIRDLTEQVSHCLDVLLELTHPDWWNQIRRKVGSCGSWVGPSAGWCFLYSPQQTAAGKKCGLLSSLQTSGGTHDR